MNYREIYIGPLIKQLVTELGIESFRICNFLNATEYEINLMYKSKTLDTETLLKWSKLLEYDFFRIYTQHLILYSPLNSTDNPDRTGKTTSLPQFRKNVYTKEVVDFILEKIESGEMTKIQVMERYKIPKTTLYKWIQKYKD
ncbi:recombinase family protein [Chryseobacterium viscerum]|uniref:Transposase n=1 Tax=Chryseobacterium viscerum TaxID=1037377 RepID=A0A316WH26_9FLAO|nr:recombinase family protein [Chryseobacterium viscerum]PWN58388.1 transposase [Chryseobacterium viscerum]